MRHSTRIEMEVAGLGDLRYADLAELWMRDHGCRSPRGIKRRLLERSAAFALQAKAFGGLSPTARKTLRTAMRIVETKRHLRQAGSASELNATRPREFDTESSVELHASGTAAPVTKRPAAERVLLAPGSRLLREWNGRQHFVDVGEDGFTFDGKLYRSLSAIARKITGAQWSGPRFFGL